MILVDVNLLLYAENSSAKEHPIAKAWWESALLSEIEMAFDWTTILAFLRITTSRQVFPMPLSSKQATERMDLWLTRRHVHIVQPGPNHWKILSGLIDLHQIVSKSVPDAHLAAVAIENGWDLYSSDEGFSKYRGLRWINPIATTN